MGELTLSRGVRRDGDLGRLACGINLIGSLFLYIFQYLLGINYVSVPACTSPLNKRNILLPCLVSRLSWKRG